MAGLQPLPPHVVHSSSRLNHAEAHHILSDFLSTAENDAGYRPDSTLTERGPQSASTGASPNLTLHHLRRILQGIEGKRVGVPIGGEEGMMTLFGDLASANRGKKRNSSGQQKGTNGIPLNSSQQSTRGSQQGKSDIQARYDTVDRNADDNTDGIVIAANEEDGWQNKDDYELAQTEELHDVAQDEAHPAGVDQPDDTKQAEEEMEVHVEKSVSLTAQEKAERKKAKKERHKAEKQKRHKDRSQK